jgi:hypothetical protein
MTLNLEHAALIEARFSLSGRNPSEFNRMSVSAEYIEKAENRTAATHTIVVFFMFFPLQH